MTAPLLSVEGLRVAFSSHRGTVTALRDATFALEPGRPPALVGESG